MFFYNDNCLSKTKIFEWHLIFKDDRDRPTIKEESNHKLCDFMKVSKKLSVIFMEIEFGIHKTIIHEIILTE